LLTLRTLVEEMGLVLAGGERGADAPLRWVHISELTDPTPWLSGGELILTTGLQLTSPKGQREFVRRLAGNHLVGIGLGTGFTHRTMPRALVEEADTLGFPIFEVPYELPFIAITEKAFARLVNEQYDVLQRSIAIHKRLERLVLEERGIDELVRALAAAIGGAVLVLDSRGEVLAYRAFRRELPEGAIELVRQEVSARRTRHADGAGAGFVPDHPELAGRALVLPVSTRVSGAPDAWLAAAADAGGLGDFERLILQQAATVVALELMRQRAMRDTERRLAGDVLAEVLTGGLEGGEVASRLAPFGVGGNAAVLVLTPPDPALAEVELHRYMRDAGVGALVATRGELLCAVVDARDGLDPVELAGRARSALEVDGAPIMAAASRAAPVGGLRRSFHEARCALTVAAVTDNGGPRVASYRDLGAFQLLLSLQDDEALQLYRDSVLGPLEEAGGDYGDELIRSLEAFIEHNGQWEKAARELYCHRHTLRYRIRRVEELTGRDLRSARDRIELWLAIQARDLVA
jgi:purine catabolism regulatory family protein/PucR-like helix-turn-helix protein/diguanylate cyclase with GGDEF domain